MPIFGFVTVGSHHRHAREACPVNARAPMLDFERDWPVCEDCLNVVAEEVRRESGHRKNDPVRCLNCAAWVLPGNECGTCGAVAT